MGWDAENPRNECYPSSPSDPTKRRAWMDARNLRIGDHGAARAVASSGVSIGAPKKEKS